MSDETMDLLAVIGVWTYTVVGVLIVWVAVMLSSVPLSVVGGCIALYGAFMLGRVHQADKEYDED